MPAGTGQEPSAFANGVVTPHASFLAIRFAPRESMANLRSLTQTFPIYGPYGFLDSVDTTSGEVADCVLALDQGIIMAAIANAICDNALQHAFSDGQIEAASVHSWRPRSLPPGPLDPPAEAAERAFDTSSNWCFENLAASSR